MITRGFVESHRAKHDKYFNGYMDHEIVKMFWGDWLAVNPNEQTVGRHIYRDGFWESWISTWFFNNVNADMKVADVGAYCGYYGFMAQAIGAKVDLWEPNLYMWDYLETTSAINNYDITINGCGISGKRGVQDLYISPDKESGSSSTYDIDGFKQIPAVFLDPGVLYKYDLIKMDIEGSEEDIFLWFKDRILPRATMLVEVEVARYKNKDFENFVFDKFSVTEIDMSGKEIEIDKFPENLTMIVLRRK